MPRKKQAKGHQLVAQFEQSSGLERLYVSPDGPMMVRAIIEGHRAQIVFCEKWLRWLETTSKRQRRQALNEMKNEIIAQVPANSKLPILEEHLLAVSQVLQGVFSTMGIAGTPPRDQKAARELISYMLQQDHTVKRFKEAFEKGFAIRASAPKGKAATLVALAQQLTPHEYRTNPDAALRSMQRGVKRVKREHEQCLSLGIPSPFLSNSIEPKPSNRHSK